MITPFQTNKRSFEAGSIDVMVGQDLIERLATIYQANDNTIILWIGGYAVNSQYQEVTILFYSIKNDGNENGSIIFPFAGKQAFQISSEQAVSNEIETRNTDNLLYELSVIYDNYPNAIILSIDRNFQNSQYFITFFKSTTGSLAFPEANTLYTV